MSSSDASTKEKSDARDRQHHVPQDGDHLEHARLEIEQERTSSPAGKRETASRLPSAPFRAEPDHLILNSPFPDSAEKSGSPTLNLHLSDQQSPAAAVSKQTFLISPDGKILGSDKEPVANLDFSKGIPNDIGFVLDRPSNFAALPPEKQKTIENAQKQAMTAFIHGDLERALKQFEASPNADSTHRAEETESVKPSSERKVDKPPHSEESPQSEAPEKKSSADRAPSSPESQHAIHKINHDMPNNHHGHMSRRQVDKHLPGYHRRNHAPNEQEQDRTNPQAAEKHLREDQVSAQKNMLAESFAPDQKDPYHTDRTRNDHSHAVGRYGIHFKHMDRMLSHALPKEVLEKLGHPPDYSKLGEILKQLQQEDPELLNKIQKNMQEAVKNGDLPESMSAKFNSPESIAALGEFTDKLRGGKGDISKAEIEKNLPQAAQDAIAQQEIERGMKNGASPGELALAHQLGKDTNELSSQEKTDNKDLMDAAGKFYALGMAKERMDNSETFHWSSTGDGQTMALIAQRMADKIHTVGDCAKGPRLMFDALGYHLPQVVATVQGRMLEESGLFKEVTNPRPGDYGYRHWNAQVTAAHAGVDKGDAFTVVGKNRAGQLIGANDHHFIVPPDGGRYRGLKFLRPTEEFYRLYGPNKGAA